MCSLDSRPTPYRNVTVRARGPNCAAWHRLTGRAGRGGAGVGGATHHLTYLQESERGNNPLAFNQHLRTNALSISTAVCEVSVTGLFCCEGGWKGVEKWKERGGGEANKAAITEREMELPGLCMGGPRPIEASRICSTVGKKVVSYD